MRQYLTIITLFLFAVIASACGNTQVPVTSGATQTFIPTIPITTDAPDIVEFTDFSITPLSDQEVAINACTQGKGGVGITLKVSYNTSPHGDESGEWKVLKELGVPCFNPIDRPTWNISELQPGKYLVKVEAKTAEDPNWIHPISKTMIYEVK